MKLIIDYVKFSNFLSYGNYETHIDLSSNNVTLVRGKNGSGKSSIYNAITFALFGTSYRDTNKGDYVNDITNKGCLVELGFHTSDVKKYKIIRGIKPDKFEVYENDQLINQNVDARKYQAELESQIIKCNYKSFTQVVVLGSSSYTPFMKLSGPQRREIIEDLLDLTSFADMTVILKKKVTTFEGEISKLSGKRETFKEKIKFLEKAKSEIVQSNDDVIAEFERLRSEYLENKKVFEKEFSEFDDLTQWSQDDSNNLTKIISRIDSFTKALTEADYKISALLKEIKFLQDNDHCPTCHQEIASDFKNEMVKNKFAEKSDIESPLNSFRDKVQTLKDQKKKQENKQQEIRLNVQKKNDILRNIDTVNQNISSIDKKIENVRNKKPGIFDDVELQKLEGQIREANILFDDLSDESKHTSAALKFLPLIKGHIIRKFVPIFNEQIKFYLGKLDFPIKFELDETFNETITIRDREGKGYGSLSTGQQGRVDLALLFAWRAVAKLRNSIDCNLLLFDEVGSSNIDYDGMMLLKEMISNLKNTNVFVISHREEDTSGQGFDCIIDVYKRGHFSQIRID